MTDPPLIAVAHAGFPAGLCRCPWIYGGRRVRSVPRGTRRSLLRRGRKKFRCSL